MSDTNADTTSTEDTEVSEAAAPKTPFAKMECPNCDTKGTVPGIKRHFTRMHPDLDKDSVDWPDIR